MNRGLLSFIVVWCLLGVAGACGGTPEPTGQSSKPLPTAVVNPIADQALRDAALEGQIDLLAKAMTDGARVDAPDADGRTALMYAAFNGHTDCIRWLFDRGAAIGVREGQGRTALMFASTGPFSQTVKLLLESGANPHNADTFEGWTALMFAAGEGQLEVVQVLLDGGANPSDKDFDGDVAADHAAKNHHPEVEGLLRESMP